MSSYITPPRKVPHITTGDEDFRKKFRSWNLGDLSYVDINEYLATKDVVLVPMASTEQHGPHLPLYTDTITAIEVSARVSEQIGILHTPLFGLVILHNICMAQDRVVEQLLLELKL